MAWKSFLSIKLYIQNDINSVKIIYMYIYVHGRKKIVRNYT